MQANRILVTGATGFVGQLLCAKLAAAAYPTTAVVRNNGQLEAEVTILEKDLTADTEWDAVLSEIDTVVHLAGRAHVLKETAEDPYQAFAQINIDATRQLVNAAANAGVKRFIFMSTVKVCGETSNTPMDEALAVNPQDDYAQTKAVAERIIKAAADGSSMDYVIIRPPLVYGPKVKANFKRLLSISRSQWPLPLGGLHNQRSLIYIENLVDFVLACILHPNAANQVFFVSDDEDVSTTALIKQLAAYQNRKVCLFSISPWIVKCCLNLVKPSLYTKLCANLQIDISKAKALIGWQPPFSLADGLKKTVGKQ